MKGKLAALALLALPGHAQTPLSAIDWLSQNPPGEAAPGPDEPLTAQTVAIPSVTVAPLEDPATRRLGLVPGRVTGLPETIWRNADGARVAQKLDRLSTLRLPAAQSLLYTLVLSEALPPSTGAVELELARIDTLIRQGALDPALALARQAGPTRNAALFERFFDAALLAGSEGEACQLLFSDSAPRARYPLQIFCAARSGDWQTAALLLNAAQGVGDVSDDQAQMLARFLDPELFEDEPALPIPAQPGALEAIMYEAIGTPLDTSALPRVYANLDLRDVAGWKARLEAAERLAASGALDSNRLLGIFTSRRPAASGGIWDRVRAIQRFETALRSGSAEAVGKTLPPALEAAQQGQFIVPLADLFAERVLAAPPAGSAGAIAAFNFVLLSGRYEQAPKAFPAPARADPLAVAIAEGRALDTTLEDPLRNALREGFAAAKADPATLDLARRGALGPAILDTLVALDQGARGDLRMLSQALATLRALGLEDTARRAALQILLLGPAW